jgi:hypothetical protein
MRILKNLEMKSAAISLLGFLLSVPPRCMAAEVPPQLLNKTITAKFTLQTNGHSEDGGTVSTPHLWIQTIYISSLGRVFMKVFSQNGPTETHYVAPGPGFRWENGKLIREVYLVSGAQKETISFAADFQSCSLDVIVAKDRGKPRVWIGNDGKRWSSSDPVTFQNRGCSVSAGNALAAD